MNFGQQTLLISEDNSLSKESVFETADGRILKAISYKQTADSIFINCPLILQNNSNEEKIIERFKNIDLVFFNAYSTDSLIKIGPLHVDDWQNGSAPVLFIPPHDKAWLIIKGSFKTDDIPLFNWIADQQIGCYLFLNRFPDSSNPDPYFRDDDFAWYDIPFQRNQAI